MKTKKWKKVKLKTLCNRIGDGLHGTPNYSYNSDIFFINGNNLVNGKILVSKNTMKVTDVEWHDNFIELNKNSLLLSINGTIGEMAFYNDEKLMLGKSVAYLNFKTGINIFYYYYFQLQNIQKYFYQIATGSTIKNLGLKSIQDFEVPYPNKESWKPITSILCELDKKIEINNKINSELEAAAKLTYDYWFMQFDFPDENGKPYKSSGGKMVYNEDLKREIPKGWVFGTLDDLGTIDGGSTPSSKDPSNFCSHGMPWLTPADMSRNKSRKYITRGKRDVSAKGIESASLQIYPKGTVLLTSRAPVGYIAIARNEVTTNQGFKSFTPNKGYPEHYIFYVLVGCMKSILNYSSGSTFNEISGSILKTVPISKPPPSIAKEFSETISNIATLQNNCELENEALEELRNWLLPMLMNGQVTVSKASKYKRENLD